MTRRRNPSRLSATSRNRNLESLESRQLMTTAMGVDSSFDGLYEIDLDTGAVSEIGKLHPNANRYTTPVSMAIRPSDNRIFVINNSPSQDEGLSVVNASTGRATKVGSTDATSITFDDSGRLFGIAAGNKLARVNPGTGATTTIPGADALPRVYGLDYNTYDGNFYGVTGNVDGEAWLLKISPAGKNLAKVKIGASLGSVPGGISIDHGVGVVSNLHNRLYKVDLASGNVLETTRADKTPQGLDTPTQRAAQGPALAVDAATDSLYRINLDTGATSKIGPLHPASNRYMTPVSMAIRPSDNRVFVINNSPDADAGLSVVNTNTGRATKIGDSDASSITFDNRDRLFGIVNGKLARVNQANGKTQIIGSDALPRLYGMDFNPEDGNFYGVTGYVDGEAWLLKISPDGQLLERSQLTENIGSVPGAITIDQGVGVVSNLHDRLFKVNLDTGKVVDSVRAEESPQGLDIAARPLRPQRPDGAVLGVDAHTDSLYKIDLNTGVATKIGPLHPSDSRYTTPVSMAIRASDDAIFVINNSPVGDSGLATLNPHTGRATLVGPTQVNSLAFDAADNLYGILAGKLAKVDPATGKARSLGGDALPVLYGLDYSWDDGHLYGVTGGAAGYARILKITTTGEIVSSTSLSRNIGTVPGSLVFDADGQMVISNLSRKLFDVDPATGAVHNARDAERLPQGMGVSSTIRPGQPAKLIGDLNGDGKVGFDDFLTLSGNFGEKVDTRAEGDLTGDCQVGFDDFLMLSANYGKQLLPTIDLDDLVLDGVLDGILDPNPTIGQPWMDSLEFVIG